MRWLCRFKALFSRGTYSLFPATAFAVEVLIYLRRHGQNLLWTQPVRTMILHGASENVDRTG